MKVHVRIGGLLTKPSGRSELELDLPEGATVKDLLSAVGYTEEHIPRIMTMVGGAIRKPQYVLADRDEVRLSILVGGG